MRKDRPIHFLYSDCTEGITCLFSACERTLAKHFLKYTIYVGLVTCKKCLRKLRRVDAKDVIHYGYYNNMTCCTRKPSEREWKVTCMNLHEVTCLACIEALKENPHFNYRKELELHFAIIMRSARLITNE